MEVKRIPARLYLYNVDDLQGVADAGLEERKKEAERGEQIVAGEVETFLRWRSSLDVVPTIIALREKAEAQKREELAKVFAKMPELGEKEKKLVEQMAGALVNKLIHPPTAALKEDAEDKDELVATIKRLYGIDDEGSDESADGSENGSRSRD